MGKVIDLTRRRYIELITIDNFTPPVNGITFGHKEIDSKTYWGVPLGELPFNVLRLPVVLDEMLYKAFKSDNLLKDHPPFGLIECGFDAEALQFIDLPESDAESIPILILWKFNLIRSRGNSVRVEKGATLIDSEIVYITEERMPQYQVVALLEVNAEIVIENTDSDDLIRLIRKGEDIYVVAPEAYLPD